MATIDTFIAPPCHEHIQILFEDEHLLVINKPSGLLSLSSKNPLNKDSVHYRLVQDFPTATMVHRLDFGTSGVMVLALNKDANAHLTKQFQARTMVKTYVATLYGHLEDNEGMIDLPLAKAEFPYQKVCHKTGKQALSHYQMLQRMQDSLSGLKTTQVRFKPQTGRTHQLRVHSQAIGHPILGCDLYGLLVDSVGGQVNTESMAQRLMLHASSLEFVHPVMGERLCFKA